MEVLALHELQQLCRMRALPFVGKNKSELIQLLTNPAKPPAPAEADGITSKDCVAPPNTEIKDDTKAVALPKAVGSPVKTTSQKEKTVVSPIVTTGDKEKDVSSPAGDDSDDETVAALFPSEYTSLDISMLYYLCRVRRLDDDGSRLELIKRLEASDPRKMPVDELKVKCRELGFSQAGSTGKIVRRLMQSIAGVTPKAKQAQETKNATPLVLRPTTITAMNLTSEDETRIAELFPEDYETLTVAQLQQACVGRGLVATEASKKELVRRLRKADPRYMTQSLLRGLCLYRGLSQSGANQDMIERVMVNLYKTHRQTALASASSEVVQDHEPTPKSVESVGASPGKTPSTGVCESTDSEGLSQESCVSPPSQELQSARPQLGQFSEDPFLHMSRERLTELCHHRGLSIKGSRYEIVQNLLANEAEASSPKPSAPSSEKQNASSSADARRDCEREATKAIKEGKPPTANALKSTTPPSATEDSVTAETPEKPVKDLSMPKKSDETEQPQHVLAKDRWAQLISDQVNSAASSPGDDNTRQPDDPAKTPTPAISDVDAPDENLATTELGETSIVDIGVKTNVGKAAGVKLRAKRLAKMVLANDDDDSDNTMPSEHSDDSDFKVDETVEESEDDFDADEMLLDELDETPPRKRKPALTRRPKSRRRLVQYLDEAATEQAEAPVLQPRDPTAPPTFEDVFSDHSIVSVHSDDSDFKVDDFVEETDDDFDADEGLLDFLDATPPKKRKKLARKSKSKKPAARKPNRTMARWLGPAAAQRVETSSPPVAAAIEKAQEVFEQPKQTEVQAEEERVATEPPSVQHDEVLLVQREEQPQQAGTLNEQQLTESRQEEALSKEAPVLQSEQTAPNLEAAPHTDPPAVDPPQQSVVQHFESAAIQQQDQPKALPEPDPTEQPDQPGIQQERDEVEQPDQSVEPEPVEENSGNADFDEVDDFGDDDLLDPHAVDAADMDLDSDDDYDDGGDDAELLDRRVVSPAKVKVVLDPKEPALVLPDRAETQDDEDDGLELRVQQPTRPTQKPQQIVLQPAQSSTRTRARPHPATRAVPKATKRCYVVYTIRTPTISPQGPPEFTFYKVFANQAPASDEVRKVFYGNHPEGWGETVFKCVEKAKCIRTDYSSGILKLSVEPPYMPWKAGAVAVATVNANITTQDEAFIVCSIHTHNPRKNITPPQVECHEVFATKEAANAGMAKFFYDECPWRHENSASDPELTNREGLHSMCAFNYDGDGWLVNVCKVAGGDAPSPADWFIVYDKTASESREEAEVQFYPPVRSVAEANELVKRVFAESNQQNHTTPEHVTTHFNHHGLMTQFSRTNGIEHVTEARLVPSNSSISEEQPDSVVVVMSTKGRCVNRNFRLREPTMTVEALMPPGIAGINRVVRSLFFDKNPYGWSREDFTAFSRGAKGAGSDITNRIVNELLEMTIAPVGMPTWSVRGQLITSSAKTKTISERQYQSPQPAQVQRRPQPAAFGGYGSPVLKVSYSTPSPADVGSSLVHQKKRPSSGSTHSASSKKKRLSKTQGDISQGQGPGGTISPPSMARSHSDEPLETVWPMRAMEETHWIV